MTGFPISFRAFFYAIFRTVLVLVLLAASVSQTGCSGMMFIGGGTNIECGSGSVPVPMISSVNPASLDLQKQPLPTLITVYGQKFQQSSVVSLNSVALKTEYVSPTMLQATLDTATWLLVSANSNGFFIAVSTAGFPGGPFPKNCPNGGTSSNIVIIITG